MSKVSLSEEQLGMLMKIPQKIAQVDRIYEEIYKRRAKLYQTLVAQQNNLSENKIILELKINKNAIEIICLIMIAPSY